MSTTDIGTISVANLSTWRAYDVATSGDTALADRLDKIATWAERFTPTTDLGFLSHLSHADVSAVDDRKLLVTLRTTIGQITCDLDFVARTVSEITGVTVQRPTVTMGHLVTPYFAVAEFAEKHGLVLVSPGNLTVAA